MSTHSTVLLIGAGRLARHLQHWNSLLPQPHRLLHWNRSQDPENPVAGLRAKLRELPPGGRVWLAISDRALIPFYEEHLRSSDLRVVHFSGALHDSRMLGAHPLMSFPETPLPDEVYPRIHFAISGFDRLEEALPGFTNPYTFLGESGRPFYHALCVLAGNFPQLIWNQVAAEMKKLQLPEEALDIYIRQIAENYLRLKEKSLTGPLIRGDRPTIEKNINALEANPPLQRIYRAIDKEYSA